MRVVVAGAGIAGLEALIGLHELAGERVALTLLAPVAIAFPTGRCGPSRPFALLLRSGTWTCGRPRTTSARGSCATSSPTSTPTAGARPHPQRRPDPLRRAAARRRRSPPAAAARGRRVVPRPGGRRAARARSWASSSAERRAAPRSWSRPAPGGRWTRTSWRWSPRIVRAGREIVLVTAEQEPLEALGGEVGAAMGDELDAAGRPAAHGRGAGGRDGRGPRGRAARVTPAPRSRASSTTRTGSWSSTSTPASRRLPGVFAAGDATALGLKHSTLAAAQGRAAAEAIAAEAGAEVRPEPW